MLAIIILKAKKGKKKMGRSWPSSVNQGDLPGVGAMS
jgi:hypothetical protein